MEAHSQTALSNLALCLSTGTCRCLHIHPSVTSPVGGSKSSETFQGAFSIPAILMGNEVNFYCKYPSGLQGVAPRAFPPGICSDSDTLLSPPKKSKQQKTLVHAPVRGDKTKQQGAVSSLRDSQSSRFLACRCICFAASKSPSLRPSAPTRL